MTTILTAVAVTAAVLSALAVVALWRLARDAGLRAERSVAQLDAERGRAESARAALTRYEVTFASISGRGELGEQVLVRTAQALGLRQDVHYRVQTDVAGGGRARPDLLLVVGAGRLVPVDAKTSLATWFEAVETDDPAERADALRVHARTLRARAAELVSRGYEQWADAVYGTVLFVPSDAAAVAALEADPGLHRWLLERRVFLCGPTGFAIVASAALHAASERALVHDVGLVRAGAARAHRAAAAAVDAANVTGTHLDRAVAARRRELEALDAFRAAVAPLADASGRPTALPAVRDAAIALADPGDDAAALRERAS